MPSRTRSDLKISNGRLVIDNGELRERVKVLEGALERAIGRLKDARDVIVSEGICDEDDGDVENENEMIQELTDVLGPRVCGALYMRLDRRERSKAAGKSGGTGR